MRAAVLTLFAVIGLAGLAAPFFKLTASSFWGDELLTVYHLGLDSSIWTAFIERQSIDFHPPLYPILLRLWLIPLDAGDAAIRAFSAALGCGLGALVFHWARRRLDLEAALFALAFTVSAGAYVFYSVEARNYMLAYLLATGLFLLLLKARDARAKGDALSGGYWAALLALGLALSWTHYFGFLFTGAVYAYLLLLHLRSRTRWIVLCLGALTFALIAGYVLWSSGRMIVDPTVNPVTNHWRGFVAVAWLYLYGGLGGNIALPLFCLVMLAWLLGLRLTSGGRAALREDLSLAAPIIFISLFVYLAGAAVSVLYTPVLFANRVGIAWPACWITLAILFWRLITSLPEGGRVVLRGLAVLALLGGLPLWLASAQPVKEEWRASARYLEGLADCRGEVIVFPVRHAFHTDWERHTFFQAMLKHYWEDKSFAQIKPVLDDDLVEGDLPPELVALARDRERACPVLLWAVHIVNYQNLTVLKDRLEAAIPGLSLEIREFAHESLWLWSGEWLWAPEPPAHGRAFLLLRAS